MKFLAVVPARWASSRFPGKPLAELGGIPMILRTAWRAQEASHVSRVVVATDDARIQAICESAGVEVVITSSSHATGTDRVVEAARALGHQSIVNIQGDEPFVDPTHIDALIAGLLEDDEALVSNAACPLESGLVDNPNVVKAASGQDRRLLYLSRSPIPFSWGSEQSRLRHLGMYAFRGDALTRFASRSAGPLELSERVEMFRYLEHGDPIVLVTVPLTAPAVDVPEDVSRLEAFAAANGGWPHRS